MAFTKPQHNEYLDFAQDLCFKAGAILIKYFHQPKLSMNRKMDNTLVTEADLASDTFITEALHKQFPQDFILSEEESPCLDQPNHNGWIIDPLDGTTNFSLGLHYWGVLITRIEHGYPVASVQYFPIIDELYTVELSAPALMNRSPIHVELPSQEQKLSFFSCCSRTYRTYDISIRYKTRIFGCAAYSMASVARGASRIAFEAQAKIWDIAGAWILVPQAGGVITTLNGSPPFPLSIAGDYRKIDFPIVAASSADFLYEAKTRIKPKRSHEEFNL